MSANEATSNQATKRRHASYIEGGNTGDPKTEMRTAALVAFTALPKAKELYHLMIVKSDSPFSSTQNVPVANHSIRTPPFGRCNLRLTLLSWSRISKVQIFRLLNQLSAIFILQKLLRPRKYLHGQVGESG